MSVRTITPQALAKKMSAVDGIELIDVRTPVEFREVHVQNAKNIPLDQLDPAKVLSERTSTAAEPLYVICHKGGRGSQACQMFLQAGYAEVINVEGGTAACVAAELSVVRGKKAISLERQVRIAAGCLVLLGIMFSYLAHPYFLGLSAFVGAGLIFAGLTDTCGMGMLLARMPWNQVNDSCRP